MLNWLFPVTLRFKYTGRCGEVICCYTENLHLCCWMDHSEWSSLERKALLTFFDFCLFSFILPGHSPLLREVRAGTEAEAMGEHCLVPWSLWFILNQLYHSTRITFPGVAPLTVGGALPNHDSPPHPNHDSPPQSRQSLRGMATDQCDIDSPSTETPFSQVALDRTSWQSNLNGIYVNAIPL